MTYLLDTHTLLWTLFEDEKLSEKTRDAISNAENEIYDKRNILLGNIIKKCLGKMEVGRNNPGGVPEKRKKKKNEKKEAIGEEGNNF